MNINEKTESTPKSKIISFCDDLAKHSSAFDQLISERGLISNPVIQGHIECHLDKIEDSLVDICDKYQLGQPQLTDDTAQDSDSKYHNIKTQRQGMKLLQHSIRSLETRVKDLIYSKKNSLVHLPSSPLNELSRILNNDLCRTSYLLA